MNKDDLIKILREEQYPEFMIGDTIAKIERFKSPVKKGFSEWVTKGLIPKVEIEGYSYDRLITEYRMKPIGAFITLDWLIRDPDKAVKSLQKGIK